MPIKRLSQTSLVSFQKHSNMLAGNPAYLPPVYDLLETTVLGTAVSSVTFSSLGSYSNYKHLQVRYVARSSVTDADEREVDVRLNNDSGSNYAYHRLNGTGSSVISQASSSQAEMRLGQLSTNANSNLAWASGILDVLDFSSSSKNTTIRSLSGCAGASGLPLKKITLYSGFWNNTAAVTSIRLAPDAGNFIIGSRFSLYGIK